MMTKRNVFFKLASSVMVCLAIASVSEGTVPRAFVSINGLDTNPCSAVQPCRSFNQALTVVETGGEIVVQNSGGYSTGFTITKSVTIDAAGLNASVISTTATDLCTINAGASDRVVLRGISFHGASVGTNAIHCIQMGSLYLEHCSIAEFTVDGVRMVDGGNLWVTDDDVHKCGNDGLDVGTSGATPASLVAQDSRFTECDTGIFLGANPGTGSVTGWLSNCTASASRIGFEVLSNTGANGDLTLTNCRAFGNTNGLVAEAFSAGNATMRIVNCVVTKNGTGITTFSSSSGVTSVLGTSPATNLIAGNGSGNVASGSLTLQ